MSTTIYKYPFRIRDDVEINAPAGAEPLHVGVQNGTPCLWMRVDPTAAAVSHRFRLAGTGHPLGKVVGRHVGSFTMHGALVFHLFVAAPG